MTTNNLSNSLNGMNIALSVRMPKKEEWKDEDATHINMQHFVAKFCEQVFRAGGRIVHEDPTAYMPIIVHQASLHARPANQKPVLLFISATQSYAIDSRFLKNHSNWVEIRIIEQAAQLPSDLLQSHLIANADCLVAVGGQRNDERVNQEIDLALEQQLPTFILGGTGGKTDSYASKESPFFAGLNNGLREEENRQLLNCDNVYLDTQFLFDHIRAYSRVFTPGKSLVALSYDYYQPDFFATIRDLSPEIRVRFVQWLKNDDWDFYGLGTILVGYSPIELVTQALLSIAVLLDSAKQRKKLHGFIRCVKAFVVQGVNWDYELIKAADQNNLPAWVVEGLSLSSGIIKLEENKDTVSILIWYFSLILINGDYNWKIKRQFCNGMVNEIEIDKSKFVTLLTDSENIINKYYKESRLSDTDRQGRKIQALQDQEKDSPIFASFFRKLRSIIIPQNTAPNSVDKELLKGLMMGAT